MSPISAENHRQITHQFARFSCLFNGPVGILRDPGRRRQGWDFKLTYGSVGSIGSNEKNEHAGCDTSLLHHASPCHPITTDDDDNNHQIRFPKQHQNPLTHRLSLDVLSVKMNWMDRRCQKWLDVELLLLFLSNFVLLVMQEKCVRAAAEPNFWVAFVRMKIDIFFETCIAHNSIQWTTIFAV